MARKLGLVAVESHCAQKANSERTLPFGPTTVVYKIGGKIFALLGHHQGKEIVSLKCDPDRSPILRDSYAAIIPGYHLNKTHWNSLILDGTIPRGLVLQLVDHSYELVS